VVPHSVLQLSNTSIREVQLHPRALQAECTKTGCECLASHMILITADRLRDPLNAATVLHIHCKQSQALFDDAAYEKGQSYCLALG
jgi:hypothetical protein